MAFIETIQARSASGKLKQVYDAAIARSDRVANIIRIMSQDAASLAASMNFYVSLMKRDNALSASRREMLATVVSNINDCYY